MILRTSQGKVLSLLCDSCHLYVVGVSVQLYSEKIEVKYWVDNAAVTSSIGSNIHMEVANKKKIKLNVTKTI